MYCFQFPALPVSVNKLYTVARGRKILTTAGRNWRQAFLAAQGGMSTKDFLAIRVEREQAYTLEVWFYIAPEDLYNLSWGVKAKTKHPYKNVDVSNLIKLVEDCIAKLVGLSDRNNFDVLLHKREAYSQGPRVVAYLYPSALEDDPHEAGAAG
jgi:Holliday junction resolvase RusA-like endonuclease